MTGVLIRLRTRWRLVLAALVLAGATFVGLSFCVGPRSYYDAKYRGAPVAVRPTLTRLPVRPIRQTESHTCGYCALTAIYTAYGLDPAAMRLRFRLGTDMPVTRLDESTRGTIPPDIRRVLEQDGFTCEFVDAATDEGARDAREHLESGHVALALVRVSEWHWLVLADLEEGAVTICDSLRDEVYTEPVDDYLRERVERLYLILPKTR